MIGLSDIFDRGIMPQQNQFAIPAFHHIDQTDTIFIGIMRIHVHIPFITQAAVHDGKRMQGKFGHQTRIGIDPFYWPAGAEAKSCHISIS